jgi:hypothetical protein
MSRVRAKEQVKRLLDIFLIAPGSNSVLTNEVNAICAAIETEEFQPVVSTRDKLKLISGSAAVLFGDRKWTGRIEVQQAVARNAINKLGKLIELSPA